MPFYHTKVRLIACRFFPLVPGAVLPGDPEHEHEHKQQGRASMPLPKFSTHSIALLPFDTSLLSLGPTHRLSRISLHLVLTLHMHTWGLMHSYIKRVQHNILVPREAATRS